MQRRQWLQLGLASAAILALGGGAAILLGERGIAGGQLAAGGKRVMTSMGAAILDGWLPPSENARRMALQAWLNRLDATLSALPPHTQAEIDQLLTLLASAPGRWSLVGLNIDWTDASVAEVQGALMAMSQSSLSLRKQACMGLRELTLAAYFADAASWKTLGYPGPITINPPAAQA